VDVPTAGFLTARTLSRTVPPAVPGIMFLSGGCLLSGGWLVDWLVVGRLDGCSYGWSVVGHVLHVQLLLVQALFCASILRENRTCRIARAFGAHIKLCTIKCPSTVFVCAGLSITHLLSMSVLV
jgi:hypothetical protein